MDASVEAIARWLGAHAVVFFALATAAALAVALLLWRAIVRHTPGWVAVSARGWSGLERRLPAARLHRLRNAWSRAAVYFTAYATFAFVTATAGLALFLELADGIAEGETVAGFDRAFSASLGETIAPSTRALFAALTHLGDPLALGAAATIVALALLWRGRRLLAVTWIVATAGNGLLTRALKALFERSRPAHDAALLWHESYSFPSGHASGALAVYLMLLYVTLRGRPPAWWHTPLAATALAVIMLVGFSRVVLQVHYPSDVIAGYAVAGTWLALCIAGAEVARAWRDRGAR